MCGGMKFMDLSKESDKKRCICNYGSCESDVSIQVSLDDLNTIIVAVRKEYENEICQLSDRYGKELHDLNSARLATSIFKLELLLNNLEKLRSYYEETVSLWQQHIFCRSNCSVYWK